ncbi:hypothetical protein F5884DRAFT_664349 [Xylogone sp. PMI_703]|nr:hypothetical protein F5884DRAFT_664349 [Xylogone sp. PMI_703]
MGQVTYRDGVAIIQIFFFSISLVLDIILAVRRGFGRLAYLIGALCLLRLIGASCQLVAISHPSVGVYTTSIVCTSIGLSPLTLVLLGMLARVNDYLPRKLNKRIWFLISILTITGVALGISGAVDAASSSHSNYFHPNTQTKAAILIFTGAFAIVVLVFLYFCTQMSSLDQGEKQLLYVVGFCIPFLAVRLVYPIIGDFANSAQFNALTGNVTIYLFMDVLEEIIVTMICVTTLLRLTFYRKNVDERDVEGARGTTLSNDPTLNDGNKLRKPSRY